MKETTKDKEPNTILFWYALIYNAITIYFIYDMEKDPSSSLAYVGTFPIFWISGAIILGVLFKKKKIRLESRNDKIAFVFSTPVPFFVLIFIFAILGR